MGIGKVIAISMPWVVLGIALISHQKAEIIAIILIFVFLSSIIISANFD